MAFVQPITIKEAIDRINKKEFLIPAIQREFVWETYQIERLFDSLMKDYPISSFLFGRLKKVISIVIGSMNSCVNIMKNIIHTIQKPT